MHRIIGLVLVLGAAYVVVGVIATLFQRRMLYFPARNAGGPADYGLEEFEDLRLKSADGTVVQAWYRKARPGYPTIAYFHGNAGHLGFRASIYSALSEQGFGVFGLSYRGYSHSEGSPTESGLYLDGRAAFQYLSDLKIPPARIILYGESLGTGVAVDVASETKVGAIVLQAPYTSIVDRAAELYWFFPVRFFLRDRFDSLKKISKIASPLLILHGEHDEVIPLRHGEILFKAAPEPKKFELFKNGAHNDFDSAVVADLVREFALQANLLS